jgi:hypothetical protein
MDKHKGPFVFEARMDHKGERERRIDHFLSSRLTEKSDPVVWTQMLVVKIHRWRIAGVITDFLHSIGGAVKEQ